MSNKIAERLQRKFDRQAIDQLRTELSTLAEKVDQLETQLNHAQQDADCWYDLSMDLMNDETQPTHKSVGLTQSGDLIVIENNSL